MSRLLSFIFAFVVLAACDTPFAALRAQGDLIVRGGTSFGMCAGRCSTQLRIEGTEAVFIETSRDPGEPARSRTLQLDESEWKAIAGAANLDRFQGLQEVYGCPDCADGGMEWVEVEQGGTVRRVTFEYGATVEKIQPLIDRVRAVRERFPR